MTVKLYIVHQAVKGTLSMYMYIALSKSTDTYTVRTGRCPWVKPVVRMMLREIHVKQNRKIVINYFQNYLIG